MYLNGINSKQQDNDFLREPLTFFCILGYPTTVGEVIKICSDLFQFRLGNCQFPKGTKGLRSTDQISSECYLDHQCSILRRQFLLLAPVISNNTSSSGKSLSPKKRRQSLSTIKCFKGYLKYMLFEHYFQ